MLDKCIAAIVLVFLVSSARAEDEAEFRQRLAKFVKNADELELYSIDFRQKNAPTTFHGFAVVGSTKCNDAKTKAKLVSSFGRAITTGDDNFAFCFYPRHALRATSNKVTVDIVICFECRWVWAFRPEDKRPRKKITIMDAPRETFNAVLREAEIPITE